MLTKPEEVVLITKKSIVSMMLSLVVLAALTGVSPVEAKNSGESKPKVGIKKKKLKKRSKHRKARVKKKTQSKKKNQKAFQKSVEDEF